MLRVFDELVGGWVGHGPQGKEYQRGDERIAPRRPGEAEQDAYDDECEQRVVDEGGTRAVGLEPADQIERYRNQEGAEDVGILEHAFGPPRAEKQLGIRH